MENRHRDALRRIYQADDWLRRDGREPEVFHLRHPGGMAQEIDHPRWDRSWHTIDDLGELNLLRVEPSHNRARTFALTMKGREEGAALAEQLGATHHPGVG